MVDTTSGIWRALTEEVFNLGGSYHDLTRILSDSNFRRNLAEIIVGVKQIKKVRVTVCYDRPLSKMVDVGNYDYVDSDIRSENFPVKLTGVVEREVYFVHLNRAATTDEVLEEQDKMGLLPADLPTLLSIGEQYPEEQRKYPIVALAQPWHRVYGYNMPCLGQWNTERILYLGFVLSKRKWVTNCHFATISK